MTLTEIITEEIKNLKKELKTEDKPLAIQIPEGLKQFSCTILDELKDFEPLLFVDPCYGACDLKAVDSKILGCKTLLHFGHRQLPGLKVPKGIKIIYVPLNFEYTKSQIEYVVSEIKKLGLQNINLVTTVQYLSNISVIKKELEKIEITVLISEKTKRLQEHQILGCDCSNIKDTTNPIVFIGDGWFHINNVSYTHRKQNVYLINPMINHCEKITYNEKFLRQRYAAIARAIECKSFGILVSSKPGQNRLKQANKIKTILEKNGKKTYLLISDYINENYLLGIEVDCYINTACPRIAYDDFSSFKKPIISATEIEQMFNIKKEIKIDQIN
ncbi:MAG: diphthamide biosynthesis enzyme Dph2 [archaeon]|jgi:2-(3-amino-3-carboxypropyl)histidine synthase